MSLELIIKKKRIIFTRIFVAAVAAALLFSWSRWEVNELYSTFLFTVGMVMVGFATVGRLWCNLYICGYKTGTLITSGPYSMCRNPLYFFSLTGAIGVGLTTETVSFAVLCLVVFLMYYPFVIRAEEKRLAKIHGSEYQQYLKEVPGFIPSLKRFHEPEEYTVMAKSFRKSLFDAMWFIWLVAIVEIIEAFHEANVLPVYINLY
ncbi:MAG: isoprenylcysteine carboxylmethyltransferase family protein [Phycisphaerae bacterium]|jgi:protein-S-isoprenylcysteine O-methyltransferase Ste14